ncbi:hypothetical protein BAUCODRAFT_39575 [Baudoinia panamericana UAMH 10762]|uniref:BZIP domain-containing protein n=1 Tax=Baudoinia panamericana (strain UAMH 10762) TaxID=717646 RepID=M2M481_BAUPA|nr:uncharacterized protein BAUCODRAFT_39575 [Baudoinia panamericana UAMH 10762]EMC91406.1 hypothetical protein BAUCODRAFT_39575 [Baudoinia panamericana UAMH 10762]
MSQADSCSTPSATSPADDWISVRNPSERRRIQNRIAQRKYRRTSLRCWVHGLADRQTGEKARFERETAERDAENERRCGGAYTTPDPDDIDAGDVAGLPWGGIPLRHVVSAGKAKEQSSRETSLHAAISQTRSSSRLGLHLLDQYARGSPAWTAWRHLVPFAHSQQLLQPPTSTPFRDCTPQERLRNDG